MTAQAATQHLEESPAWRRFIGGFAWRTVLLTFAILTCFGTVVAAAVSGAIPIWLGSILNLVLIYAAFTPAHEASHGNINGRHHGLRWLNELCGWLSMGLLCDNFAVLRAAHMRHHAHTNDPEQDPDYFLPGSGPLTVLVRSYAIFVGYVGAYRDEVKRMGQEGRHYAGAFAWHAMLGAIVIAFAVNGYLAEVLLLWILPALASLLFLALVFDYVPHWPHRESDRYQNTRIFLFPGLTTLLLSQNYHLIHHLYPTIPFYRYGACFREIHDELIEHDVKILGRS